MNPIQQSLDPIQQSLDELDLVRTDPDSLLSDGARRSLAAVTTSLRSLQKDGAELPAVTPEDRRFLTDNPNTDDVIAWMQDYARTAVAAALGRGAVAQGLKLIGYSCDEGGCGRIHETQDGDYMQPVYVLAAPSPEATQPTQAEAQTQRLYAPDFGPCPEISRGDSEAAWSHGCLTGYRAALATQQAVQAEPAAWLRDDFGDCVTTQKKRDMTEHNGLPGRRLAEHYNIPLVPYTATPPAPGQVERINLSTFAWGVTRMGDNPKAVLVSFRSEPTDDDLRALHEALRPASGRTVHANAAQPGQVERERLAWLHSPASNNVDGYEWGIFRVKWEGGKAIEVCHTYSDFSDLDAAIRAARSSEGGSND